MEQPKVQTELRDVTAKIPGAPCRILFKQENQQPSGSFKLRGLGALVGEEIAKARSAGKQKVHVLSSSGGNAGLAAAYASRHYGTECTVVLPQTYKPSVAQTLEEYGAKVIIQGRHWGEADKYLVDHVIGGLPADVHPVYVHPFDHPSIWSGHATLVDEIEAQLDPQDWPKVKAVVCSVGGGGLYNGIVEGLKRSRGLQNVPVIAVETEKAPTFAEAIRQGKVVHLEKVDTVATCLASPYICAKSLANYNAHATTSVLISDSQAVEAMLKYYDTFDEVVEPACGAAVHAAYSELLSGYSHDDIVVVIVCGGRLVQPQDIPSYREFIE